MIRRARVNPVPDAVAIDVREPDEYVAGHVPAADLVPLSRLTSYVAPLPRGVPVHVICASGNCSLAAADFLARAGASLIWTDSVRVPA